MTGGRTSGSLPAHGGAHGGRDAPPVLQPVAGKWQRPGLSAPGRPPAPLAPPRAAETELPTLPPPPAPTLTVEPLRPRAAPGAPAPRPAARRLDLQAAVAAVAGLALASCAAAVPALKFIFSYLTIIIHETGHALFGWLFGYPSIPAFDFRYGGGVALHRTRSVGVLVGFYVLMGVAGWLYRRNPLTLALLGALLGVHAWLAYTGAHHVVILFMGHGTEIVLAGVFLYRALTGSGIIRAVERPLYAFCGFFILICDVVFAYGLATHHGQRLLYEAAKGGGHWMDFSRIAERHLHVELASVATFFGVCCLAVPIVSFAASRYAAYVRAALHRIGRRA